MKQIIKQIRELSGLTQEQFAHELGTTAVSINRWENGKTQLNTMAGTQLYRFCKERSLDISDIIVQDYSCDNTDDKLVLYHASRSGIKGEIAPISRSECDFGKGFYMGTNSLQPLTLVCSEKKPRFYTLKLDLTGLKILNLDAHMDWAMLIAYNRGQMEQAKGTQIYEKYASMAADYDVVTGYIANDRMYTELTRFFRGDITDVALMKCLAALDLGKQYVAISEKACRQIKVLGERALTGFELAVLQDMSTERRKKGVSLADEIVKQYRREGRYFDEIIGG